MKTYKNKKNYISPEIYIIELDKKISLAMESESSYPDGDPDSPLWSQNQNSLSSDPFKNQWT
ncbi:MAG: hypothetical protein PHS59_00765 [Paludibacter sp.]|nr:hypothetical protein [Paludibacter sp.]